MLKGSHFLCDDKLTGYLKNVGYVCHTLIPELDKFTSDNRLGMYPSPVSVAVPKYGWILFLSFDSKSHCTTLYHARLHSPVDKIVAIKKNLKSENVQCCGNVAFLSSSRGPIVTHELEANYLLLKPDKLTTKQRIAEVHERFNLPPCDGTIKSQQEKLKRHLESKRQWYIDRGGKPDEISFEDTELTNDIEAMHIHSRDLLFVAATKERKIASVELCYDGVGTKAKNTTVIMDYDDNWEGVSSLTVSGSALFVAHHDGVLKVSLETNMPVVIYEGNCKGCCLAPFQNRGALFADQHRSSIYIIRDDNEISAFAGTGVTGSQDGPAGTCQFQQPIAICTEFDTIAYVCDAQTNSIKIITQVKETAKFLHGVGKLYKAFSVHNKGERYQKHTLQESSDLLSDCKATLSEFEKLVRSKEDIGKRTLNGPEGCVAAVTVKSVDLLHWGMRQLSRNVGKFCYENADLLSCLTLDVEHLHATSHRKHPLMSKQEYCRSLGNTVKESVKRLSTSSFFYFTSVKRPWYPKPQRMKEFCDLSVIEPLPVVKMNASDVEEMRTFASTFGAAVRQRTNRQETTMSKHGTMPEYVYQRTLECTDGAVVVDFTADLANQREPINESGYEGHDDEQNEYDDSSSDDDELDKDDRTQGPTQIDEVDE